MAIVDSQPLLWLLLLPAICQPSLSVLQNGAIMLPLPLDSTVDCPLTSVIKVSQAGDEAQLI